MPPYIAANKFLKIFTYYHQHHSMSSSMFIVIIVDHQHLQPWVIRVPVSPSLHLERLPIYAVCLRHLLHVRFEESPKVWQFGQFRTPILHIRFVWNFAKIFSLPWLEVGGCANELCNSSLSIMFPLSK